jgi:hypothetical protein
MSRFTTDGPLSDTVNLTRAKDALASLEATDATDF